MKKHEKEFNDLKQALASNESVTLSDIFEKSFPFYHETLFKGLGLDEVKLTLEELFQRTPKDSVLIKLKNALYAAEKFVRDNSITVELFMKSRHMAQQEAIS